MATSKLVELVIAAALVILSALLLGQVIKKATSQELNKSLSIEERVRL